jgi:hypothetical protein
MTINLLGYWLLGKDTTFLNSRSLTGSGSARPFASGSHEARFIHPAL